HPALAPLYKNRIGVGYEEMNVRMRFDQPSRFSWPELPHVGKSDRVLRILRQQVLEAAQFLIIVAGLPGKTEFNMQHDRPVAAESKGDPRSHLRRIKFLFNLPGEVSLLLVPDHRFGYRTEARVGAHLR